METTTAEPAWAAAIPVTTKMPAPMDGAHADGRGVEQAEHRLQSRARAVGHLPAEPRP
jgi:hypothetical protein